MQSLFKSLSVLLISALSVLSLASCGGGGGDGSVTGSAGTVNVALTDADLLYDQVVLTVKEVGVVASGAATTYYNSSQVGRLPTSVDVLDFPNEEAFHLASLSIPFPEGADQVCFNQVRLRLAMEGDPDCPAAGCNYVIEQGDPTVHPLQTPSGQQSGIKILTPNGFCVTPDQDTVEVVIDFDPATAIVHNRNSGNGREKYIIKPTGIRIIEGGWSVAPESFVEGVVAVPTYNTATGECLPFATDPVVTVTAFEDGTLADPVARTVSFTEGPMYNVAVCSAWCADDPDPGGCQAGCVAELMSDCYYSGGFKLLLPSDTEVYDLQASWDAFFAGEQDVTYNTAVLMELLE